MSELSFKKPVVFTFKKVKFVWYFNVWRWSWILRHGSGSRDSKNADPMRIRIQNPAEKLFLFLNLFYVSNLYENKISSRITFLQIINCLYSKIIIWSLTCLLIFTPFHPCLIVQSWLQTTRQLCLAEVKKVPVPTAPY